MSSVSLPRHYARYACIVVLSAVGALSLFLRLHFWVVNGGLRSEPFSASHSLSASVPHDIAASDYLAYADEYYFGGISMSYLQEAGHIARGELRRISPTYPPGYAAFLAMWQLLGVTSHQTLRLIQLAIDSCVPWLIFLFLRSLRVSTPSASAASLIYSVAPWLARGSTFLTAESISPLLFALLLFVAAQAGLETRWTGWLAIGALCAWLGLNRSDLLLVGPGLAVYAYARSRRHVLATCGVLLGFALPVLALGGWNAFVHDRFLIGAPASSYGFWSGLGQVPNDHGYYVSDAKASEELDAHGIAFHSREAERYWWDRYCHAWRNHPGHVLRTIGFRFRLILTEVDYLPWDWGRIYMWGWSLLVLAAIVVFRRGDRARVFLLCGPVVYALGTVGIMYVEHRYVRYVSLSYVIAFGVLIDVVAGFLRRVGGPFVSLLTHLVIVTILIGSVGRQYGSLREECDVEILTPAVKEQFRGQAAGLNGTEVALEWRGPSGKFQIAPDGEGTNKIVFNGIPQTRASARVPLGAERGIRIRVHGALDRGAVRVGLNSLGLQGDLATGEFHLGQGLETIDLIAALPTRDRRAWLWLTGAGEQRSRVRSLRVELTGICVATSVRSPLSSSWPWLAAVAAYRHINRSIDTTPFIECKLAAPLEERVPFHPGNRPTSPVLK